MFVELKVNSQVIFYVAAGLTLINLVLLFFFDDSEFKKEGSKIALLDDEVSKQIKEQRLSENANEK